VQESHTYTIAQTLTILDRPSDDELIIRWQKTQHLSANLDHLLRVNDLGLLLLPVCLALFWTIYLYIFFGPPNHLAYIHTYVDGMSMMACRGCRTLCSSSYICCEATRKGRVPALDATTGPVSSHIVVCNILPSAYHALVVVGVCTSHSFG
jgi:hypothetical protein